MVSGVLPGAGRPYADSHPRLARYRPRWSLGREAGTERAAAPTAAAPAYAGAGFLMFEFAPRRLSRARHLTVRPGLPCAARSLGDVLSRASGAHGRVGVSHRSRSATSAMLAAQSPVGLPPPVRTMPHTARYCWQLALRTESGSTIRPPGRSWVRQWSPRIPVFRPGTRSAPRYSRCQCQARVGAA